MDENVPECTEMGGVKYWVMGNGFISPPIFLIDLGLDRKILFY
jgi:hypothetical protein